MKLELKHIPQIAYELEIQILNSKCDYVGIERAKVNGHYYINDVLYLKYEGGSAGKSQNECKPILRPLSDLSEEISINGKKVIPIIELLKIEEVTDELDTFEIINGDEYCIIDFCNEFGDNRFYCDWQNRLTFQKGTKEPNNHKPIFNFQSLYIKLLEWHFDVFGLIPQGLAIDINTLNK